MSYTEYWIELAARFIFVVIIEHAVFLAVRFIDYVIPDRSKTLVANTEAEAWLTNKIITKAKYENQKSKDKSFTNDGFEIEIASEIATEL